MPKARPVVDQDRQKADAKRASTEWRARIGTGIRAARTRAGYSQAELANQIGVDMSTISDIERGVSVFARYIAICLGQTTFAVLRSEIRSALVIL